MTERRQSPAVYRRRRQVAAVLALVLVALLIWGVTAVVGMVTGDDTDPDASAPVPTATASPSASPSSTDNSSTDNDDAEPSPSASGSPSASDSPSPSPTLQEPEVEEGYCAPSDIELTASTNREEYGRSDAPLLIMEIENTSNQECTLDVGTSEQRFKVDRDGRQIFSVGQCDFRGRSLEMDFEPGQIERAQLTWPRSDSQADCEEPAELPTGEYELTVGLGGNESEPVSFEMAGVEDS